MDPKPYVATHKEPWLKWQKAFGDVWVATSHGGSVSGGFILQISRTTINVNQLCFSRLDQELHDVVNAMLFAEDMAVRMLKAEYGVLLKHAAQEP